MLGSRVYTSNHQLEWINVLGYSTVQPTTRCLSIGGQFAGATPSGKSLVMEILSQDRYGVTGRLKVYHIVSCCCVLLSSHFPCLPLTFKSGAIPATLVSPGLIFASSPSEHYNNFTLPFARCVSQRKLCLGSQLHISITAAPSLRAYLARIEAAPLLSSPA